MKNSYDLIITKSGPTPMQPGTFEELNGLSLAKFNPDDYITHESPRAIYRIDKRDAQSRAIARFLSRADKLPPIE